MIARGMSSCIAVTGSCTSTMPPARRMQIAPADPSFPVPDRMTPVAFAPRSRARLSKNVSMVSMQGREDRPSSGVVRNTPRSSVNT
jgi:hypothetical protein